VRRAIAAAVILTAAGAAIALAGSGDPDAEWRSLAPSPFSRTEVGAARIGRHAYVVGGFEERSGRTTRAMARYDLARNSWARVRSMPVGVNHPAVTAHDGFLYVAGGFTEARSLSGHSPRLYRYDPRRNSWRRLRDAPTARAAHTMQAIDGRLYLVGGVDPSGATGRLETYDIERNRWSTGLSMPTPREHLASAVLRGRLHVFAGRTGAGGNFTAHEAYNPRTRRWSTLPAMRKARGGIAAAAVDSGRAVVVGGEEAAGTIAEVELYDVARRRWTALADMRTPRHGLGAVAYRGRVFALEGGPQPGFAFSNAVEALRVP
jgi:N-acetylneuraminic acid mutarotase